MCGGLAQKPAVSANRSARIRNRGIPAPPIRGEALSKCLLAGLGKSRSLRGAACNRVSKVAHLLRKWSPRLSQVSWASKGTHASLDVTLSSSRGARGVLCFTSSRVSFHPPIAKCGMLSGIFVALFRHLRLKPHHEDAHTVLFPHFCRL